MIGVTPPNSPPKHQFPAKQRQVVSGSDEYQYHKFSNNQTDYEKDSEYHTDSSAVKVTYLVSALESNFTALEANYKVAVERLENVTTKCRDYEEILEKSLNDVLILRREKASSRSLIHSILHN